MKLPIVPYLLLSAGAFLFFGCGSKNPGDPGSYQASKSCIENDIDVRDRKDVRIRNRIRVDEKATKIDSRFVIKRRECFNGNVLIAQECVTIYETSCGYGDIRKRDALTRDSRFQLASLSKTFTA